MKRERMGSTEFMVETFFWSILLCAVHPLALLKKFYSRQMFRKNYWLPRAYCLVVPKYQRLDQLGVPGHAQQDSSHQASYRIIKKEILDMRSSLVWSTGCVGIHLLSIRSSSILPTWTTPILEYRLRKFGRSYWTGHTKESYLLICRSAAPMVRKDTVMLTITKTWISTAIHANSVYSLCRIWL